MIILTNYTLLSFIMKIGYARVSTKEQSFDLQIDSLTAAGCEKIFKEKASGTKSLRPILEQLIDQLRPDDILIVYKLDRLGRSLKNLIHILSQLETKQVSFISLHDNIDTTTTAGKLIFHLFASIAEFERELIRERTKSGLEAARSRGRVGGRPKGLSQEAIKTAIASEALYNSKKYSVSQICKKMGISKPTLYNYLRYRGVTIGG